MTVSTKESWRTRETKQQKGINELKKQFVKSELMNYHYFKACYDALEKRRIELTQRYEDRLESAGGGSVIKLPDGSSSASPWQIEKTTEICNLIQHMKTYEVRLDTIDQWMECLTVDQKESVMEYVVNRQCTSLEEAAQCLGKTDKAVYNAQERAINRIISNFL